MSNSIDSVIDEIKQANKHYYRIVLNPDRSSLMVREMHYLDELKCPEDRLVDDRHFDTREEAEHELAIINYMLGHPSPEVVKALCRLRSNT